jgi:hypothetical protein
MASERAPVMTGGCQCGAVRYALIAEPTEPSICHCRMCQKAFGNYMAPLTGVRLDELAWTRGTPGVFQSSDKVERGFCRDCGTPLFYRVLSHDRISVSIGSLDEPDRVAPLAQYGIEAKSPHFDGLHRLAGEATTETYANTSRQHPDHDTETWPSAR